MIGNLNLDRSYSVTAIELLCASYLYLREAFDAPEFTRIIRGITRDIVVDEEVKDGNSKGKD